MPNNQRNEPIDPSAASLLTDWRAAERATVAAQEAAESAALAAQEAVRAAEAARRAAASARAALEAARQNVTDADEALSRADEAAAAAGSKSERAQATHGDAAVAEAGARDRFHERERQVRDHLADHELVTPLGSPASSSSTS